MKFPDVTAMLASKCSWWSWWELEMVVLVLSSNRCLTAHNNNHPIDRARRSTILAGWLTYATNISISKRTMHYKLMELSWVARTRRKCWGVLGSVGSGMWDTRKCGEKYGDQNYQRRQWSEGESHGNRVKSLPDMLQLLLMHGLQILSPQLTQ